MSGMDKKIKGRVFTMKFTQNLQTIIRMIIEHCTQIRKIRPLVNKDYMQMLKSLLPELKTFDLGTAETLLFICGIGCMDEEEFNEFYDSCDHDNNALYAILACPDQEGYSRMERLTEMFALVFSSIDMDLELQKGLERLGLSV
jgi:hypothetical protein